MSPFCERGIALLKFLQGGTSMKVWFKFLMLILVLVSSIARAEHAEERLMIFGNKLLTVSADAKMSKRALEKTLSKYLTQAKEMEKVFHANQSKSELYKINNLPRPAFDVKVSKPMAKLMHDYDDIKTKLGDCFLNCERSTTNESIAENQKLQIGNTSYFELGVSVDGYVVEHLYELMKKNTKISQFEIKFGRVQGHFSRKDSAVAVELIDRLRPPVLPVSIQTLSLSNEFVATGSVGGAINPKMPYRQVTIVSSNATMASVLADRLAQNPMQKLDVLKTLPGVRRVMIQKVKGEWVEL